MKKRRFFNFGLEQKLDHHSYVKFHSDSDGDGFKAQKPKIGPQIGPNWPWWPLKTEFFNFGLEQKLDRHYCVEFHGDSGGIGFKAQKPIIDPLIGLNWP